MEANTGNPVEPHDDHQGAMCWCTDGRHGEPLPDPGTRIEQTAPPEGCDPVMTVAEKYRDVTDQIRNVAGTHGFIEVTLKASRTRLFLNTRNIVACWPVKREAEHG